MPKSLTTTDVKRIRNALQSVGTPAFAARYKRLLAAKLKVDTFLLIRFDPDAPPTVQSGWLRRRVVPEVALEEYCDRTYLFDPFFQFRGFAAQGGVYHLPQIAPDRFFSSKYYLEYYRKTGLCDEVGLLAPLPDGSTAHLSLSRLESSGPYTRREIGCLQHYGPLLVELLVQHNLALQEQEDQGSAKTQFSPLSDIIRTQALDLFAVHLTNRESQIAALVLLGHSNRSAALKLGIARETNKVHRRNLYRKLSISSQGELFALFTHLL